MTGYTPSAPGVLLAVGGAAAVLFAVGFRLQLSAGRSALWASRLLAVLTVAATSVALSAEAAGVRMIALSSLLLMAMKAVVGVEVRRVGRPALVFRSWLAFAGGWLGMQPRAFERRRVARSREGVWLLLRASLLWVAVGGSALLSLRWLYGSIGSSHWWLCCMLALVALSMILHFGWIGLHAALLRMLGFPVEPQFRAPWLSQSLREFWAKRWNLAFSTMTQLVIYRPLAGRVGAGVATASGFLASGLLHEVGCSLPVDAAYGWPTAYFALHALAVWIEDALRARGVRVAGPWGRLWTYLWLLLPVSWLFHDAFLRGVIEPVLR
ncbi:MAG: MBOAT family protein [Planctomycetota bacterium]